MPKGVEMGLSSAGGCFTNGHFYPKTGGCCGAEAPKIGDGWDTVGRSREKSGRGFSAGDWVE